MPAYSFQERFVPLVLKGIKAQTIPGRCLGSDVVVAGVFGGYFCVYGCFLAESNILNCEKPCNICYKLIFISIISSTVKDLRLLQVTKNTTSLLQVVTLLLQVVTMFVTKL